MRVSPCIGCAYCCMKVPCRVAFLMGWDRYPDPCGGLRWDGEKGRYWCRAIENEPVATKALLKEDMAIGAGCSSSLFNGQREACARGELPAYLEARKQEDERWK